MRARDLCPPAFLPLARRARDLLREPTWEYVPEGWAREASLRSSGWKAPGVADAYAARWEAFGQALEGTAPLAVAYEVPAGSGIETESLAAHNVLMSYAYVLARAARKRDRLSVLDWGGGTGHYYLIARAALPDVELSYHVKETPAVCERGRALLPEVTFHDDDGCLDQTYELVLASSSLNYSEAWERVLARLVAATLDYLYLARVPVVLRSPSFVVLQRAYAYGYGTEYLGWALNRASLLEQAGAAGAELVREFLMREPLEIPRAPERIEYRGFLLRPPSTSASHRPAP